MSYKDLLQQLESQLLLPTPVERIYISWLPENIQLWIKRDDLIHPIISGNKWRKLKYTLEYVLTNNINHIASFGGPRSNHLHALGYCCHQLNLKFTAFVRGKHHQFQSKILQDINSWGGEIVFLSNQEYRQRSTKLYLKQLKANFPKAHFIAEGGTNKLALRGVAELLQEQTLNFDACVIPVGSGGTLAGLASANSSCQVEGICVLKNGHYLEQEISNLLKGIPTSHYHIHHSFHHGGYAKTPPDLLTFCDDFQQQTSIALEPVYSGKLFFAIKQLVTAGYFQPGAKLLALHTGGLQAGKG